MKTTISVGNWSLEQFSLKGTKTFDEILEIIADLNPDKGIDLMEDYIPCQPHTNLHELLQLKKTINSYGLIINSCWFYADLVGGIHVSSFDKLINDLKEYIVVTSTLGAKFISIPLGGLVPGMKFEEGYELIIKVFEKIVPTAEEYNVSIGLESARTSGFSSPQLALKLVKFIGSDFLTITPDFEAWRIPTEEIPGFHVESPGIETTEPVSIDIFKECLPYSPLIHAKFMTFDEKGEDPNFPIAEMMSLIKQSSREHILSIEYEGWIPDINPNLDSATATKKCISLIKRYLG